MRTGVLIAALLAGLAGPTLAQDPATGGNLITVTEQLTGLPRPDGTTSRLDVVLPLDVSQRWPVVLFVHGWSAEPGHYDGLVQNLASRGYAVAMFDQVDTFDLDLNHWIAGGKTALDALEAAEQDPASPLYGLIDMSKLAVVGHSYGGATTICLSAIDPRIQTAVALTPGVSEAVRPLLMERARQVTIPLLILGSEFDPVVNPARFARPAYEELTTAQRQYVELARGEHLNFTDFEFRYLVWRSLSYGGWIPVLDAQRTRALSRRYTNAWVDRFLGVRPDPDGYTDGRAAARDHAAGLLSRFR